MIVAADPFGDFNATSQILRYSALAREVTVPRIPSISETVLSSDSSHAKRSSEESAKTRSKPTFMEELEAAAAEIAQTNAEYEGLMIRLTEEEIARQDLELRLKAIEGRCLTIEQEAREQAWVEMEAQMEEERTRWQRAWADQVSMSLCMFVPMALADDSHRSIATRSMSTRKSISCRKGFQVG